MKICIASVFNSANQGSFQQLKELGDIYSQYGDVCYLDCGIRNVYKGVFAYFLRCCLRFKFKKAFFELKKRRLFKKKYAKLKRITMSEIGEMDLVVLGSDEIWNVTRNEMKHSFLFGQGLGEHVVSYAPSVGNSTAKDLLFEGYYEHIRSIKLISVRDDYSASVVRDCGYDKDIEIVLDPTFLKEKEQYIKDSVRNKVTEPYIALYVFQGFLDKSGECSECFTEFAKEKGMKLVSSGVWSEYAENIHSDSLFTFDYYIGADYVITNTFHGTAFAINLNKRFVTFSCGKEKIKELLRQLGLEDRDCTGKSKEEIFKMLETEIDYEEVNKKLDLLRARSLEYIKNSINIAE